MVYKKGRGAQLNPANKFLKNSESEMYFEDLPTQEARARLASENPATSYTEAFPKTIVNKVDSPDLPQSLSLNPYQGCEHGCIYCYARNTHEYWGYSTGTDFESKILYKKSAPELLRQLLQKKSWKASPIFVSGNTDCYQPIERKLEITRSLLKVFLEFKHPVSLITKNSMVTRDIDLLKPLAAEGLVHVNLSLTTLNEDLKRVMEPRTASVRNALRTIETLAADNIPVNVMLAPIIPAINDEEIFDIAKATSAAGALSMGMVVVRLNGNNALLFENWLEHNFPDRKNKVLNQIKSLHGGWLSDSRFGTRQKGEGNFAEMIHRQFKLAKLKFFAGRQMPQYNTSFYEQNRDKQMKLF